MKSLILSLLCSCFALGVFAQAGNEKAIQQETDALVSLYKLDETQADKMLVIQQRRFRNLAEIQSLKNSNEKTYYAKLKSIRQGTEASIKKMLTAEQMPIFNQQLVERRKKESEVIKTMKANGASKEDIQLAILRME